jgi:muramoyltetrapeptide carboxypeptidase LdcA involved in peptidoglycan recycling
VTRKQLGVTKNHHALSRRDFGRLVGGCLSIVVSTLATEWDIDTRNRILFLRMLMRGLIVWIVTSPSFSRR